MKEFVLKDFRADYLVELEDYLNKLSPTYEVFSIVSWASLDNWYIRVVAKKIEAKFLDSAIRL